jgi:hypothetical protein
MFSQSDSAPHNEERALEQKERKKKKKKRKKLAGPCAQTERDASPPNLVLKLSPPAFLGSMVASGQLKVQGTLENPHAKLDDIEAIGNSANPDGQFGELLRMFATGNHGFDRGI